jgi:hypothetical protein
MLADVERLRGLQATKDVTPQALSQEELKAYVDRLMGEISDEEWRTSDTLLRHLGLIRTEETLEELFGKLLGSQVAGFYDPDTSSLVVLARTGALGPIERVTMAHELTHMLQDQHFDLVKLESRGVASGLIREAQDKSDRHLGLLALTEGDATLVMSLWAQEHLTTAEILGLGAATDPESLAILNAMPLILRETLLYPYAAGLQFVFGLQRSGGWAAVDAAFAKPPDSTEQVLHPEKYTSREDPIAVDMPGDVAARLGSGWKVGLEDTFGEFDTRLWLQDAGGLPAVEAASGAAGWGGDRIALLEGPAGAWAIAWKTAWDSPAEAEEFESAAFAAIKAIQAGSDTADVLQSDETTVWVLVAPSAGVIGPLANVLGLAG